MACASLVAACTGPLSIDNRACPCSSDAYACCELTNQCLPRGALCAMFVATVDRPGGAVPQGGMVNLTVNGVDLTGADNVQLGELNLGTPADARRDRFRMAITIPHGTALGARTLSFTTRGGRGPFLSPGLITVTPINVAERGDDGGGGTPQSPFATLGRAMTAAGPGDTVVLGPGTFDDHRDPFSPFFLPPSLTLEGAGQGTTRLSDALVSNGDLTIRGLTLDHVLKIDGAGSHTIVDAVSADGPTVGFLVGTNAVQSTLEISGGSAINTSHGSAVESWGDQSTLRIIGKSTLSNADDQDGQAIWLVGDSQVLEINDATISSHGPNAVASVRKLSAHVQGATFQGPLNMMGPGSMALVEGSHFQISSPTNDMGGIYFFGANLDIRDCDFQVVGLFQSNDSAGAVTVRGSTFQNYTAPPIVLQTGVLDLGNKADPGRNQFKPGEYLREPPVALHVVAENGTASVSCSGTSIAGYLPPPESVTGPAQKQGLYEIESTVSINFY